MVQNKRMKLSQRAGALQESMLSPADNRAAVAQASMNMTQLAGIAREEAPRMAKPAGGSDGGANARRGLHHDTFSTIVEEGSRAIVTERDGRLTVVEGPAKILRWGRTVRPMDQYIAHPGEFLVVRHRDGQQTHLPGPASLWFDPRVHVRVEREEALQIAAEEAVVVYSETPDGSVSRRITKGPTTFVPAATEWLHTFSWHGSVGGRKVPNALEFQKLWLLPDQMYHDVEEVRTADDAVITIRLMVFFHLVDIERLLATSHDPIGDFVNATTSDVVEFVRKRTFDAFKASSDQLNELETYQKLVHRARQCGYVIQNVVYRGYGAPPALQQMHDAATESRTRLQLERATQQQAQELEDFKLERTLLRAERTRAEEAAAFAHQTELRRKEREEELSAMVAERNETRLQRANDAESEGRSEAEMLRRKEGHLARLGELGVDLTAYLTAGRADRVIELRGADETHVHVPG